jgi:hypothetical protein
MAGVSQPSLLAAAQQHARSLRVAGELATARVHLARALDAARPALGADSPAVLAAAHQLAGLHREAGDAAAARRVLEDAVAAGTRHLADADPLMLALSFDLGTVAEELGNRHEARRNFGRVATAGPAVLGDDHPTVRVARAYLAGEPVAARPAPELPVVGPAPAPPAPPRTVRPAPAPPAPPRTVRPTSLPPAPPVTTASVVGPPVGRPTAEQPPAWPPVAPPATPSPAPSRANRPVDLSTAGPPGPAPVAYPVPLIVTEPAPRGRGTAIFAAVAAGLAAVLATIALVVVLTDDDPAPGATGGSVSATPTVAARPPTGVTLRESGDAITVSWRDPADGQVSFIVAGGRAGEQLKAMAELGPGETRYVLNGLNPDLDYCFTVVAVYGPDAVAASSQACTDRRRGARPGAGR